MAENGSKKVANGLVAVSCAAVLAVYSAGYVRTKAAVDQFEAQAAERRAADPRPRRIEGPREEDRKGFRPKPPSVPPLERPIPVQSAVVHLDRPPEPKVAIAISPAPDVPAESPTPVPEPAPAPTPEPVVPARQPKAEAKIEAVAPAPMWKDGTYLGWGTSRHGNIQAEVVVEGGRIASATIAQCRTRYSCSVIEKLPPQVAQRQSPDVDYVSGATQSANAFYFAVVDALSHAK